VWQRFVVADRSMEPTLRDGERLFGRRSRRPFTRGEIVVIPHPRRQDFWLVKRILGLPGEKITIDFGTVLINGSEGQDLWAQGDTFPEGVWSCGPNEIFVLSDNRRATVDDSRNFGPVSGQMAFRRVGR
jgi:signal peptidase I